MRRMTIVVGPQRWEGFGLVPIEAMAGGAAVVATRAGAAHRLVAEGQTGHLVPTDNLEALVEKIEALMKDPALAAEMGRQGRDHVIEKFTVDARRMKSKASMKIAGTKRDTTRFKPLKNQSASFFFTHAFA